jgi:ribose transport system substrate-binding protein
MRFSRRTRLAGAVLVLLLAGASTACGSQAGNSNGNAATAKSSTLVAQANADLAKAEGNTAWVQPGPAFKASVDKGKTVAFIPVNSDLPFTEDVYAGFKQAMSAIGVKVKFFETNDTPSAWTEGVDEAIADKVSVIVTCGIDLSEIEPAAQATQKAHIPTIEAYISGIGVKPTGGADTVVTYNNVETGKLSADYAIAKSHANVDAVIITSDAPINVASVNGFKSELSNVCPSTCKVAATDLVPDADFATQIPTLTSSVIRANPNMNVLYLVTDAEVTYAAPEVLAAHKAGKITLIGNGATIGVLPYMWENGKILGADIGYPEQWGGYQLADQALRIMAGLKVANQSSEATPVRVFTPQNMSSEVLSEPNTKWYGTTNYASEFLNLWGAQ